MTFLGKSEQKKRCAKEFSVGMTLIDTTEIYGTPEAVGV